MAEEHTLHTCSLAHTHTLPPPHTHPTPPCHSPILCTSSLQWDRIAPVVCAQGEMTPQWRSGTLCGVVLDVLDPVQRLHLVPMELAGQRRQVLCPPPRMCGSRHCWAILQSALSAFPVLIPMLSYPCKRRALTFPSNCSPTLLPMVVAALLCASHSSTAPDTGELYTRVLQSGLNATSCPHSSKTPPKPTPVL